jgi:Domain of unknown function (DUF362)
MPLPRRPVPKLVKVKQHLPGEHIEDVRGETARRLLDAGLRNSVSRGARVAITAGSRGMGGFVELVAGVADAVKAAGGQPIVIPAMGSHGGATPEGQVEILNVLGVTETSVGAPIHASMDTIELGRAPNGATAHLDQIASEADAIIVLGRTKTHPESAEGLASGLLKMATVGLGKQRGAQEAHSHGLWESVREVPKLTLSRAKIIFGVAVLENAHRQPMILEVVAPNYEAFLASDKRLLEVSKAHLATIPFDQLDVLVVDEIGKNISGTGMDLNVIGTWRIKQGRPKIPDYDRIVALSLTAASLGNGLGIGLADFTTQRFMKTYDPRITYVNLLTATEPGSTAREGPLPLPLESDREAIEVGLYSSLAGDRPRLCRIQNTSLLEHLWISEALIDEARQNPRLTIESDPAVPEFDGAGNLF